MTKTRSVLLTALLAVTTLVPLAHGWGNEPVGEPNTHFDVQKYMWQDANQAPLDRIYFNVHMDAILLKNPAFNGDLVGAGNLNGRFSPVPLMVATGELGYWRDCNGDGYIGDATTGFREYPRALSTIDTNVCPPGSPYNANDALPLGGALRPSGPMIHEFLPIGPDNRAQSQIPHWSVNDTTARVWGDLSRPDANAASTAAIIPVPPGTLDSWNGHIRYVDDLTFQAVSDRYKLAYDAVGGGDLGLPADFYDTPLKNNNPRTPVYSVKQLYGQEKPSDPEGRPALKVWHCEAEDSDPELRPSTDVGFDTNEMYWSGGSIGDSINNTVKGLIFTTPVSTPGNPDGKLRIGQGCDGAKDEPGNEAQFPLGVSLRRNVHRLWYDDSPNERVKQSTDLYFAYFPPSRESDSQLTPQHIDPTPSGFWQGRPTYVTVNGVTGASYSTHYARVNTTDSVKFPASAFPGATFDPVLNKLVPPAYRYGEEACTAPELNYRGWDCSMWPLPSPGWLRPLQESAGQQNVWRVTLGAIYQLRDVDCNEFAPVAAGTLGPIKKDFGQDLQDTWASLTDVPMPGAARVFSTSCY